MPEGERFVPGYFDEQPMARAGVAVDRSLHPAGPLLVRSLAGDGVEPGATMAPVVFWVEVNKRAAGPRGASRRGSTCASGPPVVLERRGASEPDSGPGCKLLISGILYGAP